MYIEYIVYNNLTTNVIDIGCITACFLLGIMFVSNSMLIFIGYCATSISVLSQSESGVS